MSIPGQRLTFYLIDHHSPAELPLDGLDMAEYKSFFQETKADSIMTYTKDHWGMCYYPSKVPNAHMHPALQRDFVADVQKVLAELGKEFVAYYCIEYDEGAARTQRDWRVRQWDGQPLVREDTYARWSLCCTRTGYRQYVLAQLAEIATYRPDSVFLDIFGTSLCYCPTCREAFAAQFGYALPALWHIKAQQQADIVAFLDGNAEALLQEVKQALGGIPVTINFACHYPPSVRALLDYEFSEPLLGDNWFSAAFARDTQVALGQPLVAPGEFSAVYNYRNAISYQASLLQIAAQGCRVGMYSGSQHPNGTLEHREAALVGGAFAAAHRMGTWLVNREPVRFVGILYDYASGTQATGPFVADAILRAKAHNPHMQGVLGAMLLCEAAKVPWNIVTTEQLKNKDIAQAYQVLLVPELYTADTVVLERLKAFVQQGGLLIAAHGSLRVLEPVLGMTGQPNEGYPRNGWQGYVDVEGTACPVTACMDMDALAPDVVVSHKLRLPCVAVDDRHWVNWWPPPPEDHGELQPGVIWRTLGAGQLCYAAFDLFSMANGEFPWLWEFFASMLREKTPQLRHVTPYPQALRTAYFRQGDTWIVHLHSMTATQSGETPPVPGGVLWVSGGEGMTQVRACMVCPEEQTLAVEAVPLGWEVQLPAVALHCVVVVRWG